MKKTLLLLLLSLQIAVAQAARYRATIETRYGRITIEFSDRTPQHRDNFVKLAKEHFFDSTLFHRVIPSFVIQGGDPKSKQAKPGDHLGEGEIGYLVPAEINAEDYHHRGAVGMARDNNPQKASSGCQFYIVTGKVFSAADLDVIQQRTGRAFTPAQRDVYQTLGGTPHLDGNYTVFGYVTKGMEVVDKISAQPTNAENRPNEDVRMISVRVKKIRKFLLF